MHSAGQCCGDCGAVEAFAADYDKPRLAIFAGMPGPVVMLLQAVADRLHDFPSVSVGHIGKALDPEHIVRADHGAQLGKECIAVGYWAAGHHKNFEIVVIVLRLQIVSGGPGSEIFLGSGSQAECDFRRDPACLGRDKPYPGA